MDEKKERVLEEIARLKDKLSQTAKATIDEVVAQLQERYGQAFRITWINIKPWQAGLKIYLTPECGEPMPFTAWMSEEGAVADDYYARLRLREWEKELEGRLAALGCEAVVAAALPCCVTTGVEPSVTLSELLAKDNIVGMLVFVAMRQPVWKLNEIVEVLQEIASGYDKSVVIKCYCYGEDGYSACRKHFLSCPSASEGIMETFCPSASFTMAEQGGVGRIVKHEGIDLQGGV